MVECASRVRYFCVRKENMRFSRLKSFNKRQGFATLAAVSFAGCCFTGTVSFAADGETKSTSSDVKNLVDSSNKNLNEAENYVTSLLASNCGLDAETLRNMLSFKVLDKKTGKEMQCNLVPLFNCKEQSDCFINLHSYARDEYMKYYWTDSRIRLISPKSAAHFFLKSVRETLETCPKSVTFAIKFDGTYIGSVHVANLYGFEGADAYISYVIDEKYSGRGITNKSAKTMMDFIKCLVKSGDKCYRSLRRLRGLAKIANKASNFILQKNGFIKNEGEPSAPIPDETNEYFYYFKKVKKTKLKVKR